MFQVVVNSYGVVSKKIVLMCLTLIPMVFSQGYFLSSSGQAFHFEKVKLMEILHNNSQGKNAKETKQVKNLILNLF